MLRFGSTGDAVRHLQTALNLVPAGPALVPDGHFGLKTHGAVTTVQAAHGAAPDGIVGPITLDLLKPYFDMLDHARSRVPSARETAIRDAIVGTARAMEAAWGLPNGAPEPTPATNPSKIAIRYMTDPVTRTRQGVTSLVYMFILAGADAKHVQQARAVAPGYAHGECSGTYYADNRNGDLPSYCGIFALCVYRIAGLRLPNWSSCGQLTSLAPRHGQSDDGSKPLRAVSPKDLLPGDIGVRNPESDGHHFIVVARNGRELTCIDGNAGSYHSVVRQTYNLYDANRSYAHGNHVYSPTKGKQTCTFLSAFPKAAMA